MKTRSLNEIDQLKTLTESMQRIEESKFSVGDTVSLDINRVTAYYRDEPGELGVIKRAIASTGNKFTVSMASNFSVGIDVGDGALFDFPLSLVI